ncbi:MAG: peptide deformylase [Planctomycetaceae bacterium]
MYATVPRAAQIVVDAFDLDGQPFEIELEDFPARVVQHEYDHLEGLMFTDRISPAELNRLQLQIADLEQQFAARQKEGQIATLELLNAELDELEQART